MTAKTRRVGVGVEGRRINSGEHLLRQELKEKGDGEGGGVGVMRHFLPFSLFPQFPIKLHILRVCGGVFYNKLLKVST